jgi:hypothetical protein
MDVFNSGFRDREEGVPYFIRMNFVAAVFNNLKKKTKD